MSPILTISHYVFLTKEQRYLLNVPETEIEVVGSCTPVWVHGGQHLTKTAEEIFAKYKIRHCPEPEKQTINLIPEGFMVRFSPDVPKLLLDYRDGGSANVNLTHKNFVKINEQIVPIIHFFYVEDLEVLEKTL